MRTQLKINGEMKDVEIENGEITIIEPEKKATGWERVKKMEKYNYISFDATSNLDIESYTPSDDVAYNAANYFADKHLAKNIIRMQTLQRQMFRWQAENDVPPILVKKGNKDPQRWRIRYNYGQKRLEPDCDYYKESAMFPDFSPVFSSPQKAIECAEVFKDELTWLFTEFKWRMDG